MLRCSEQDRLREQLLEEDTEDWQRKTHFSGLERVAGVDLSFIKGDHVNACAQLVVLSYPELQVRTPPAPVWPLQRQRQQQRDVAMECVPTPNLHFELLWLFFRLCMRTVRW